MNWDSNCFIHLFGKHSFITLLLKRICRGYKNDVPRNFNMCIEIPTAMTFVWIQWTNKFNNSISVNVNVRKYSHSFKGLIVRKRHATCDRSTLFSEKVIRQVCFDWKNSYLLEGVVLMEYLNHYQMFLADINCFITYKEVKFSNIVPLFVAVTDHNFDLALK